MVSLGIFILACIATALSIRVLIPLSHKIQLLDTPNERKVHAGQIPLVGGIGMALGFSFACLFSDLQHLGYKELFASLLVLAFIGLLDDFKELKPGVRLWVQIGIGVLLGFKGNALITHLGSLLIPHHNIALSWFAIPFTTICIVGVINSINMIDGLDGFAGGFGFISLLNMLVLCLMKGYLQDIPLLMALMGSIIGFLWFNFPHPFRKNVVFMGDLGSMFLGMIMVWLCIRLTRMNIARPITLVWIMALPLLDMAGVMMHRFAQRRGVFQADRSHLHHWFLAVGYTPLHTVLVLCAWAWFLGLLGLLSEFLLLPEYWMFYGFWFVLIVYYWMIHHRSWLARRQYYQRLKLKLKGDRSSASSY